MFTVGVFFPCTYHCTVTVNSEYCVISAIARYIYINREHLGVILATYGYTLLFVSKNIFHQNYIG